MTLTNGRRQRCDSNADRQMTCLGQDRHFCAAIPRSTYHLNASRKADMAWLEDRATGSALTPSDFNLLRYGKSIIDIDAEISDCALDLGMAEQELDRSQVARTPVD